MRTLPGDLTTLQLDEMKDRMVRNHIGRRDLNDASIRAVIDDVLAGFADASVRTYIGILVEREASRRLARK